MSSSDPKIPHVPQDLIDKLHQKYPMELFKSVKKDGLERLQGVHDVISLLEHWKKEQTKDSLSVFK